MFLIASLLIVVFAGPSWWSLTLVVLAVFVEVGEFLLGLRFTRRRRDRRLAGRTGRMRADGTVDVAGEIWPATGAAPGERVTVVSVEGRRLLVSPALRPEGFEDRAAR